MRLYARNNGELASATSDADGLARIPGGLLHGGGGDEPFAIMAYGAEGDFNFLEVGRPAFDLSDRGVTGRPPAGPVDAYLYTDRGIYRPGESVHLVGLVRDNNAEAIASLPVTARLMRPDGVEVNRRQISGDRLGAYELTYDLARNSRIGSWRVEFRLDPKAPPIGSAEFRVEDFVPPQLKVALSAGDGPIVPGEAFPIEVEASYSTARRGRNWRCEAEATIAFDEAPFPNEPDFRFGLAGEEFAGTRQEIEAPATDGDGKSTAALTLTDIPELTKPLAATVRVSVVEPSGRAVTETLTRPIRQRPLAIGLRSPNGDEAVPEGQQAAVEIIAVGPDGKRIPAGGCAGNCCARAGNTIGIRSTGSGATGRSCATAADRDGGTLDVAADAPGIAVARRLPAGRYRWEVTDSDDRRAVEPAYSASGGGSKPICRTCRTSSKRPVDKAGLSAGRNGKAVRQGAVRRPGRDRDRLRSHSGDALAGLPEGRHDGRDPGRSRLEQRRLCAGQRLSALRSAPDRSRADRDALSGLPGSGSIRAPRTLGVSLTAPMWCRPRGPIEIAVKVDGAGEGRGNLCHRRRGR